jgi:hypothetical protein
MLGGLLMVMGVYMGTLISYFVAFITLMAGYLSVYVSTFVALVMMFFL